MSIKLSKVDHFAYLVSDMDKSIDFYQNVLGLKFLSREIDEEHGEEFSFFELEGGNLELLTKTEDIPEKINEISCEQRANCPHLAFSVNNIEESLEILKKQCVKISGGPYTIENKVKWAYILDPDENILELVSWM